jgi:hypothetical protein
VKEGKNKKWWLDEEKMRMWGENHNFIGLNFQFGSRSKIEKIS